MIKKFYLTPFFILSVIFYSSAFAYVDQELLTKGEKLAQTCVACHGEKGNSANPAWPNLAGQNEKYFIAQMQEFRLGPKGERDNPIMYPLAQNLSDDDIKALAYYFHLQQPQLNFAKKSESLALGEQIYRGGLLAQGIPACSSCHSPQGRGNIEAGFPWLAGQHATYTAQQLLAYKNGQRRNGLNDMMTIIAKKLDQQQIDAVANYIQGLR